MCAHTSSCRESNGTPGGPTREGKAPRAVGQRILEWLLLTLRQGTESVALARVGDPLEIVGQCTGLGSRNQQQQRKLRARREACSMALLKQSCDPETSG